MTPPFAKNLTLLALSWLLVTLASPGFAADRVKMLKSPVEVPVKLFGQDCKMTGKWESSVLSRVHAISPERIPPKQPLAQTQQALKLVQGSSDIPNALDVYRERLMKRLEQQVIFETAIPDAKKAKSVTPIRDAFQKKLNPMEREKLDSALKIVASKDYSVAAWNSAFLDRLTDALDTVLEPYPEEDYHRTTRKLGIEYNCANESSSDEDEGAE